MNVRKLRFLKCQSYLKQKIEITNFSIENNEHEMNNIWSEERNWKASSKNLITNACYHSLRKSMFIRSFILEDIREKYFDCTSLEDILIA